MTLQTIFVSLLAHLTPTVISLDASPSTRGLMKKEGQILRGVLGPPELDRIALWEVLSSAVLTRDWTEAHARIVVCWVTGADTNAADEEGEHRVRLLPFAD
jgi:telomere length regulation protein